MIYGGDEAPTPPQVRAVIVRLWQEGRTYKDIADLVGVGVATVVASFGSSERRGRTSRSERVGANSYPIRGGVEKKLKSLISAMPDSTVAELATALARAERLATSRSSVDRALAGWAHPEKKVLHRGRARHSREHRASTSLRRLRPSGGRASACLHRRVLCKTGMRREFAWAPRGQRAVGLDRFVPGRPSRSRGHSHWLGAEAHDPPRTGDWAPSSCASSVPDSSPGSGRGTSSS